MDSSEGFWFKSSLFDVESGEDLDTNPGMFGKQLAEWLQQQFYAIGYTEADAFPEDWGWRVDCQRSPFTLFVGCAAFVETNGYDTTKPLPDHGDLRWYVFPGVDTPLLSRATSRDEARTAFDEFCSQIEQVLRQETGIELLTKPARGDWEVPPPSQEFIEAEAPAPRTPLTGWLSVPLGLLTLLLLPFMYVAMIEILTNPPAGREVIVFSLSLVVLVPAIWMLQLATQLLLVRLRSLGGLLSPLMLRVIAVVVLVLPYWTIRSGYHDQYPLEFTAQVVGHSVASALLLWRAKAKAAALAKIENNCDVHR